MISAKKITLFLINAAVFLLPFTAFFALLPSLNPYAQQLSFYPFIFLGAISLLTFLYKDSFVLFSFSVLKPLQVLVALSILTFFINYSSISAASLYGRNGIGQFLNNISQLIFGILIVCTFIAALKFNGKEAFEFTIKKSIKSILVLLTLYALLEILSYNGIGTEIFDSFAGLFHHEKLVGSNIINHELNYGRVKGFTQEPSHLGIIFAIYFPFFINFGRGIYKGFIVLFLLTMFFTFSKTLYLIFIIEIFLLLYLKNKINISLNVVVIILPFIILAVIMAIYFQASSFFIDNSTVGRGTSQIAAIFGWLDSKKYLFGEGLGQHGFYTINYYQDFGGINHEFVNVLEGERWPFIHNIHVKVLVELGIIGLVTWLYCFFYFFSKVNTIIKSKYLINNKIDLYGQSVLVAIVGVFFAGFSYENFSLLFTWVAFGIFSSYIISNSRHILNK